MGDLKEEGGWWIIFSVREEGGIDQGGFRVDHEGTLYMAGIW